MPIDHESAGFETAFKRGERLRDAQPLAAGSTFRTDWIDFGPDHGDAGAFIIATASSDTDGGVLSIESSDDKQVIQDDLLVVVGPVGASRQMLVLGVSRHRYSRISYTNGAGTTAALTLDRFIVG